MPADLLNGNSVWLVLAAFLILCIFLGVRIVPQSEKHVVERFGRLRAVLGPGINFIVPFLDRVAHKISIWSGSCRRRSRTRSRRTTCW